MWKFAGVLIFAILCVNAEEDQTTQKGKIIKFSEISTSELINLWFQSIRCNLLQIFKFYGN